MFCTSAGSWITMSTSCIWQFSLWSNFPLRFHEGTWKSREMRDTRSFLNKGLSPVVIHGKGNLYLKTKKSFRKWEVEQGFSTGQLPCNPVSKQGESDPINAGAGCDPARRLFVHSLITVLSSLQPPLQLSACICYWGGVTLQQTVNSLAATEKKRPSCLLAATSYTLMCKCTCSSRSHIRTVFRSSLCTQGPVEQQ